MTLKEIELAELPPGTGTNENVSIELDSRKARLKKLNFRKSETLCVLSLVNKNTDAGEANCLN